MPTLTAAHTLLLVPLGLGVAAVLWLSARALGAATRRQRVALLVLRAAVFLCVILALVDPHWVRSHARTRLPLVAVVIDTSRSMSIADVPGEQTRTAHARALAERARRSLGDRAGVLMWGFDADLRPAANVAGLEANGAQTDIAGALRGLQRHMDTGRPSAVWLLTDGRDLGSDQDEVAAAAALLGVPVNTVGLGSDEHTPDIELWSILAPRSMRTGERAYAVATIQAPGFRGQELAVTLQGADGSSQRVNATVGEGGTATARFTVAPKQPGMQSYTISVAPLQGELTELNNSRTFVVSVDQGDRQVLLIDRPRPEFKFLRRVLEDLAGIKTAIYLQKAPDESFWLERNPPKRASLPAAAALRQYDAIVIGDVPAKLLPAEFLRATASFVTERGGGLALLGGQQSFGLGGYAETAIGDVLPLRLGGTLDGYLPSALRVTAGAAADHPVMPGNDEAVEWSRLPVLEGASLTKGAKPLADVLLEAAASGRKLPILAAQRMGAGRSLCVTSDCTFRWVFSEYATDASARAHAALWQRAVRWLSTSTNERPVSLALDKTACTVGERVRVIATVLDEDFAPVLDARVSATVTGPDKSETTVQCSPAGHAGRYEGSFRPAAAGKHTVRVAAKRGDEELGGDSAELVAHTELAELRDVRLNRPLLQRIAEVSGGKYCEPDEAEMAMAQPPPAAPVAGYQRLSVTRSWPYLVLVLLLCGLDWGLRRRWHVG